MAKKAARKRSTPSSKKKGRSARAAAPTRRRIGRKSAPARKSKGKTRAKRTVKRPATKAKAKVKVKGGNGRESTLAQTPETGRSVHGRTNPMPTKRSTGTPSGAGDSRKSPALDRERKRLREIDETVASPPSSLNPDRLHPSAARSGRSALQHAKKERTQTSPVLTGGDVDADWEDAYAVGDEAPGGDNPTPDQDRVDDIGRAMGIEYADNEELKGSDKIAERDKHRWELDPASAEDYPDHDED
jgi:hypothetical protein